MIENWNIVENKNKKLLWKDVTQTNFSEIRDIEKQIKSIPHYCNTTNSIVFETDNKDIPVVKNKNYSELVLISRYLTLDNKLYDLIGENHTQILKNNK